MANVFLDIIVPTSNGPGPAVNIAALGYLKRFSMTGVFEGTVNIEISNDGVLWSPLTTFVAPGDIKKSFAAGFVRANVVGYVSGAADLSVGSDNPGSVIALLPVPAGNGVGAPVIVSAMGQNKTFIYDGGMEASIIIEVSQDGVTFSQAAAFSGMTPANVNVCGAIQQVRIRVAGFVIGTAAVSMCAIVDSSGGGGGSAGAFVPMAGPFLIGAGTPTRSGVGIYVNPIDPTAADDGNPSTPKLTIQGALDSMTPQAGDAIEAQKSYTIFVAPGCYDADISIPNSVFAWAIKVTLVALGHVTIGDGVNPDGSSTVPRNVFWSTVGTGEFGSESYVSFTALDPDVAFGGPPPVPTCWRVSGDIVVSAVAFGGDPPAPGGPAGPHTLWLHSMRVDGGMNTTTDSPTIRFVFSDVIIVGDAICFTGPLLQAEHVSFFGAAHFAGCGLVENSNFLGALTNFEGGSVLAGSGMFGCQITLNLTIAGGGVIFVDAVTNKNLVTNGVVVVGGGMKLPAHDDQTVMFWGNTDVGAAADTRFLTPGYDTGTASLTNDKELGNGGTKTAYCLEGRHNNPDASGFNVVYTLVVDGVPSLLTLTLPAGAPAGNSALVNVDLASATKISLQAVKTGALVDGLLGATITLRGY